MLRFVVCSCADPDPSQSAPAGRRRSPLRRSCSGPRGAAARSPGRTAWPSGRTSAPAFASSGRHARLTDGKTAAEDEFDYEGDQTTHAQGVQGSGVASGVTKVLIKSCRAGNSVDSFGHALRRCADPHLKKPPLSGVSGRSGLSSSHGPPSTAPRLACRRPGAPWGSQPSGPATPCPVRAH